MPTYCAVPGCHNRGGFSFPTDVQLRKRWCVAIRRANRLGDLWKPYPSATVCERHFKEEDILYEVPKADVGQRRKRRLAEGAIPSTFETPGTGSKDESDRQKGQEIDSPQAQLQKVPLYRLPKHLQVRTASCLL